MESMRFEVKEGLIVNLEQADGDAAVRGEERCDVEIMLDGSPEECTVEWRGNEMLIQSSAPLSVRIPEASAVRVGKVTGDLILRHLSAPVMVGQVRGDLTAREIGDALNVGAVYGDAAIRAVEGMLNVEECRGDLRGEGLHGGMRVNIQGDLLLETPLTIGKEYHAHAGGDIIARFPADADARFVLEARGDIAAPLPTVEAEEPGRVIGQAGKGAVTVTLTADGDIAISMHGEEEAFPYPDLENIVARVRDQVAEALSGIPFDEMARVEFERAMNKVERKLERARRKAERAKRKAERARRRAEQTRQQAEERIRQAHIRARSWRWANVRNAPPSSSTRVSEEEQLAVLKMLQENKITVQEADALLQALEENT